MDTLKDARLGELVEMRLTLQRLIARYEREIDREGYEPILLHLSKAYHDARDAHVRVCAEIRVRGA